MALGVFVVDCTATQKAARDADSLSSGHGGKRGLPLCVYKSVLSCAMSVNRMMRLHAAQGQPRAVKTRFRVRTTAIKVHLARCRPMRVGLKWVRPVQIRDPRRCAPPQS